MSVVERKQHIEADHPQLSIQRQCDLTGLPRSSYYRESHGGQESRKNLEIMRLNDEEYTGHPFYGSRQMRNYLHRKGYNINRKRVQRLMRKMGLQSVVPSPEPASRILNTRCIHTFFGVLMYRMPIMSGALI